MSRAICDVEYSGYAATRARRFARDTVAAWRLSDIVLEVEMVTTELVTNAVLHGAPPISLELAHHGDVLRISVRDNSATAPVVTHAAADAMTGRGLALVGSLSTQWGVVPAGGGRSGKLVWAELATADVQADLPRPRTESGVSRSTVVSASTVAAEAALQADIDSAHAEAILGDTPDLDLFLDDWEALSSAATAGEPTFTVVLKDVPTRLLLDVEAHVDNVVRELTLASSESAADERTSGLHGPLAELLREVVAAFGDVRHVIKRQAVMAATRGDERVDLSLAVTAATVEAGERYLAALSEVDEFARAERLLTAESPSEHRVFRAWYVGALIAQARAHAKGEVPQPPQAFEQFLLDEVARIVSAKRTSDRASRLQHVTAAFAAAMTPSAVAHIVIAECLASVGAAGGVLALCNDVGQVVSVGGVGLEWPGSAADLIDEVLATARPIWIDTPFDGGALCALPLITCGEVIGGVALSLRAAQPFDSDDKVFIEALAAAAAQTLTRINLHEREAELAARLARLQAVGAELAQCTRVFAVCETALRHAMASIDATSGALHLPTGDHLQVFASVDFDQRALAINEVFPAADAYRRRRPVEATDDSGITTTSLPLCVDDDVRGVLSLSLPGRLPTTKLDFLVALCELCAQALVRAQALEHAASVSENFAFLAEASRQLSASSDDEHALQAAADLVVPRLADSCAIAVLEGADLVTRAVAQPDPDRVADTQELFDLQTLTTQIRDVVASGEASLLPTAELPPDFGATALLAVPLHGNGRVVGAWLLIRTDAAKPFNASDVTLVEDLGRRVGAAVATARLARELRESERSSASTSHTHLDLALAAASGGSFEWDLHTDLLTLDERMRAIFGIDKTEFGTRAETMKQRIHSDDKAMVDAIVERAISRLDDFSVEYRIRRPDGVVRWIDSRGRVLPGPDGEAQRLIGVAFDSTELREARDGVARTLEHMGDAFFSLDSGWRVTYMNAAAERMLGRTRASLVGQVLWTQFPGAVGGLFDHECRLALETRRPLAFERYVESTGRHYEVRVHPIPEGLGVYFTDITEIRRFEREQAELRAASQHAHSEAEMARRRLSFIADTAADMTTSLDPGEVCRRLAAHATDRLADWVSIYLVEGHQCVRVAAAHRDPRWKGVIAQLVNTYPIDISSNSMVARSIRTGHPMIEQPVTEQMVRDTYPDPEARALIEGVGISSILVVPMVVRDEILGAIVFMRSEPGNEFEPEDQRLAFTLAGRAALAVQNAQLYSRQTTVVEALQQAVLPERLPAINGIELSARYEPARGGAGIGGDFYDVFYLPSGRIALAVGDAAGHGLRAGALMGQLRNALRAYAFQERGPLVTLRSLSELIGGLEPDAFATAFYAELDPASGELRWANAGHPPPLVAVPGQPSRYLEGPTSPPLGIFSDFETVGGSLVLPPGSGVLMYTDGLVERRHIDITDSLQALQDLLDKEPPCPACLDLVVDGMRDETGFTDDVCVLLAVRSVDL